MDAPSLITLAAVVAAAVVIVPRVVLESAGRASDGIAQLFVPPDRGLGWPRGVQEGDDPWGWQSPAEVTRAQAAAIDERSLDRPVRRRARRPVTRPGSRPTRRSSISGPEATSWSRSGG